MSDFLMSQDNICYKPLWTSTLGPGEVLQRISLSMKGGCWQNLVVLPVQERKLVEEKRRRLMRFFTMPKFVRVIFEREARLPKIGLVSIEYLKVLVEKKIIELNMEDRFVVSTAERGVLHVEWTEDLSEWSATEILELPKGLLVGFDPNPSRPILDEDARDRPSGKGRSMKFKDQLVNAGYPPLAVSNLCVFSADSKSIRGRTSGSGETLTTTPDYYYTGASIKALIVLLAERNTYAGTCLQYFQRLFQDHRALRPTRLEMECIARLTDAFCYSAAFASPSEFVNDVLHSDHRGHTQDSLDRFYSYLQELAEEDRISKFHRYYYVSDYHISYVPFDEGVSVKLTNILEVVRICEERHDWKDRLIAFKKNHRWGYLIKEKWAAYRYICHEYLGSAYDSELEALWK